MNAAKSTPNLLNADIERLLHSHFGLSGHLNELPSYIDLNRLLETTDGRKLVVKIANVDENEMSLDFENQAMLLLNQSSFQELKIPELQLALSGQDKVEIFDANSRRCFMRVITFLDGDLWADVDTSDLSYVKSLGHSLALLDKQLVSMSHPSSCRFLSWDLQHAESIIRGKKSGIKDELQSQLIDNVLASFRANVFPIIGDLPVQIIHNDANDHNLLVNTENQSVVGLFDFGDMVSSFRIAEVAIALAYAIMNKPDIESIILALTTAYHKEYPLEKVELDALIHLIEMRLAVSVCMSNEAIIKNPDNDYLLVSQNGAWKALSRLQQLDKTALLLKLAYYCGVSSSNQKSNEAIIEYRKTHLSENLSLAYQQPLKIVEGKGAYLYSEKGDRYLDMVNNVCHVGHCHPQVVAAGQKQMSILNTNTRYLHDNIVEFSEKLLSTMPDELSVCMFVNSGSEANELALRLARNVTQRQAMVVVDGAYHGNANACIDISPYKFDGAGGMGAPSWVKKTLVPDPYRGCFRGDGELVGRQYAEDVAEKIKQLEQEGQPICAFICESIQGVGGQVFHPNGYLKFAYEAVRDAGGVCIADEVQVGMGRVGTHWWAFQTQDVVPDIVTIGKPLGNGHPLAAVVTTQKIAKSFVTGMEYFNTFGGNPVSCAIGAAVIDVIRQNNLLEHANRVGTRLKEGLLSLQKQFPIIGNVRGMGLFIGAEFVLNQTSLEPAVHQIDYVIERLKSEGILLTTEGPFHNVLKIKPPMAISESDVDFFLERLKCILGEEQAQVLA